MDAYSRGPDRGFDLPSTGSLGDYQILEIDTSHWQQGFVAVGPL